jgi:hypothetical protein
MDAKFEWDATDLQEGGEWCEARLDKLRMMALPMVGYDGRMAPFGFTPPELNLHRCPAPGDPLVGISPEHWESLRFGGSMNFMETTVPVLEENGKIT